MPKSRMFYCAPQHAYMLMEACITLRDRPTGKTPGGVNARPRSCDGCALALRVDAREVPTVALVDFLKGVMPAAERAKP